MRIATALATFTILLGVPLAHAATPAAAASASPLDAAIAGDWRPADQKARDHYRHPRESLQFWGLKPGMTILEIQPGVAGWWTEILAPYARMTKGHFYATGADLNNPKLSDEGRKERQKLEQHFAAHPEIYGSVQIVNWGKDSPPPPANTFDFILTARSVHNWMSGGTTDRVFTQLYGALKPGGILALEQHRANPGPQDPKANSGYVTEAFVIEQAEKAGFKLEARSDINANPKDTKDHPFGVWTLPPTRQSSAGNSPPDPKFDRAKYDAIGESDRMTLRFRKPGA